MKPLASITSAAFAALLAGCGYTDMHEIVLRRAPNEPAREGVDVYMAGQVVPRPFYEIALLQAVGHGSDADREDLVRALTFRAHALGCDAIVQTQIDAGYSVANATAVCVHYTASVADAAATPKPAPTSPAPAPAPEPAPDDTDDAPDGSAGTPL